MHVTMLVVNKDEYIYMSVTTNGDVSYMTKMTAQRKSVFQGTDARQPVLAAVKPLTARYVEPRDLVNLTLAQ